MLDPFTGLQVLLALGVLLLGCVVLGELPRKWLAPIWWPMLFGFLLREFAWEPALGLPGFGALLGSFEEGYTPAGDFLFFLGNIGIFLYLFREGMHPPHGGERQRASATAYDRSQVWSIALFGLAAPFALGLIFCDLVLGLSPLSPAALLVGVSLTATSIAASAKILESELQRSAHRASRSGHEAQGRLVELRREVLSAAVIDDFLGLLMLLFVVAYVGGHDASALDIVLGFLSRTGIVLGVILVAVTLVIVGANIPSVRYAADLAVRHPSTRRLMPLNTWRTRGILALLLLVVAASEHYRVSGLVAAYLFGVLLIWLSNPDEHEEMALIRAETSQIAGVLLPIYFAMSGMMVSSELVAAHLGDVVLLTVVAVLSKWLGSLLGALVGEAIRLGGPGFGKRLWKTSLVFGPAMVPRGEVALVVVNIGFVLGVLDRTVLNILLVTVVVTTFVGPIIFKLALRRWAG